MDKLAVAFLVIALLCLGGISCIGAATLMHIRRRRERLQMKKHVQAIEVVDWNEVVRRT